MSECWLQDTRLQNKAALAAAHKDSAELQKQLSDLKAESQRTEGIVQVVQEGVTSLSLLPLSSCALCCMFSRLQQDALTTSASNSQIPSTAQHSITCVILGIAVGLHS